MNIQEMKEKREKSTATYLTMFYLEYKKNNEDSLYYFYENIDDALYYDNIITTLHSDKEINNIKCGNKEKVLATYNILSIKKDYDKNKIMYFIDKDFSNNSVVNTSEVYITPSHSIENLYAHPQTINSIARADYDMTSRDRDIIVKKYKELLDDYNERLISLNSLIAYQEEKYPNIKLYLNDKEKECFVDEIISTDLKLGCELNEIKDFDQLELIFKEIKEMNRDELDAKNREFMPIDQKFFEFRGKYEFKFLISFLQRLKTYHTHSENGDYILENKYKKTKLELIKGKYESSLAAKAYTPQSLVEYINKFR